MADNSNYANKKKKKKNNISNWTVAEEKLLLELRNSRLEGKWTLIAKIMKNKTPNQCLYRYKKLKSENSKISDSNIMKNNDEKVELDILVTNLKVRKYFARIRNCEMEDYDKILFQRKYKKICMASKEIKFKEKTSDNENENDELRTITDSSVLSYEHKLSIDRNKLSNLKKSEKTISIEEESIISLNDRGIINIFTNSHYNPTSKDNAAHNDNFSQTNFNFNNVNTYNNLSYNEQVSSIFKEFLSMVNKDGRTLTLTLNTDNLVSNQNNYSIEHNKMETMFLTNIKNYITSFKLTEETYIEVYVKFLTFLAGVNIINCNTCFKCIYSLELQVSIINNIIEIIQRRILVESK